MTTPSTSKKPTEKELTKAELQRIEERRHVEAVIRDARRVRFPRRGPATASQGSPVKAQRTKPAKQPPRPLTPAEQQRIAERRRVEAVMKNARRSRLRFGRKPLPAPASAATGAQAEPTPRAVGVRPSVAAFGVAVLVLAGTVLGLTIKTAVQNGRLVRDLAAVREKTSTSSSQQQTSLDKVMEIQSQVTRVEAGLADIKSNQDSLRTALTSLEAARTSDAAQWQERLSRVEVATREGIAEVTSRMDREEGLASSVNKLLPLLQPSSSTAPEQTESETPP